MPLGQADQVGHEVEARLDARPEGDEAAGQPPGGAGAGDARSTSTPVSRR